ncbi:FGGY family carbohydrate kinase [Lysinibacter cavernae]|uniref:Glycerol kinase n=1 Tax=Lysinibacter cavernae TaxID=1640652 RepID=A0A7X5TTA5_9MICO|nr:FGGY family carbohydrate kinase [Lysinibacter cavernae]NIH53965.1 glycerol kinase [Lysinibacter cavernae]
MTTAAILAIDEGTTGTRAAWVTRDGAVHSLEYRPLRVSTPQPGIVEQDANIILEQTIDACRTVISCAARDGVELTGLAIATQRATTVLWDTATGRALVPAMVWQDSRYSHELADLSSEWDARLIPLVGRPTGVRSPYLWAAHHLRETPEVAEAYRERRLGFGTVETWLLWSLSEERSYFATSTNATSAGAYVLAEHRYETDWIQALGFPLDLLPELAQDAQHLGTTNAGVLGISVPILAAAGDQHAGTVGLGCLTAGQAMCVHGTGSFVDLVIGSKAPVKPGLYDGALTLTAWRQHNTSVFAIETFTATTGSALDWLCNTLGWFDSSAQISELAATVSSSKGVSFVPALTGLRMPVMEPNARASLTGFEMSTTRAEIAYAVLEGIAHSVATSAEADVEVAGTPLTEIVVGGGMSASDPLIQMQADLIGVPMRRLSGSEGASLRGAAFLAGSDGLLWDSLQDAAASLGRGDVFEPSISSADREERRAAWGQRIASELGLVRTH